MKGRPPVTIAAIVGGVVAYAAGWPWWGASLAALAVYGVLSIPQAFSRRT